MFTNRTDPEAVAYPQLSDLRGAVLSAWKPALEHLGLVRIGSDSAGFKKSTVNEEIENILSYIRMSAFYNSSLDDIDNRRRFVAEYALRHFTKDSLRRLQIPAESFVKRAVRNIALVYKWGATRWHETKDDQLQAVLSRSTIDRAAKNWNRLYTLSDYAAVMPTVRETRSGKKLDFIIVGADESRVKLDSHGNMIAFAYHTPRYDEDGTMVENVIAVWTDSEYYYIDADGQQGTFSDDATNPYGEIPWTIFTSNPLMPYETGGRAGLVDACIHANYLKLLATEDAVFAALGIWFGVNIGETGTTKIGPNFPIFAQVERPDIPTPSLEYIKGEPHAALLDDLKWSEEKRAMLNEGMSPAMLMQEAQELSGTALRNLSRETMEQREDDVDVMAECERDLYRKIAIVCNRDMNAGLSGDEYLYHVAFDDPVYIDDMAAEYELDKQKLDDGVMGVDEFLRKYDSDVADEAEAIQRIQQRKASLSRVNNARGSLADALRARVAPPAVAPAAPPVGGENG